MTTLFQSAQFILTPQDYELLIICFYLGLTLPQERSPLHLLAQKCGLQLVLCQFYLQMETQETLPT